MDFLNTLNVLWIMFALLCLFSGIIYIIDILSERIFDAAAFAGIFFSFVVILHNIAHVILGSISAIDWWILLGGITFTLIMLFAGWIRDKIKDKKAKKIQKEKLEEYKQLDKEWAEVN